MQQETPSWEQFKENAAPLERGRRVAALEESLSQESSEKKREENQRMIQQYERLVRPSEVAAATTASNARGEANGSSTTAPGSLGSTAVTAIDDDPLIHWLSYIKFHQEAFPSDTQTQFLLMERCTRSLVNVPKYANDVRFIRVCATYADKTTNAGEIFKFLHQQNVGKHTALFWIAWAWWAEKQEDFQFAEKIYKKAISKQAHPIDIIHQRHKQFQRRMSRHWLNSSASNNPHHNDNLVEDGGGRSRGILGALSEESVRKNNRSSRYNNHPSSANRGSHPSNNLATFVDRTVSRNSRRGEPQRQNNNNAQSSAGFSIFVEGDENQNHHIEDDVRLDDRYSQHQHKRRLPREKDKRKENTLLPEPWNERGGHYNPSTTSYNSHYHHQPPSQSSSSQHRISSSTTTPFAVYVDEECAAKHVQEEENKRVQEERQRRHRDERTFREREDGGVAEKLVKDPLRYVRNPASLEADQAQERAPNHHQNTNQTQDQLRNHNKKAEKVPHSKTSSTSCMYGFNKRLLGKDSLGQESCFEEARSKSKYYKLVHQSTNFNHLFVSRPNSAFIDDSGMEMDDTGLEGEISMEDENCTNSGLLLQQHKSVDKHADENVKGKLLFRNDASFDNNNNVSSCSSTLNEVSAVGLPTTKEEETINTKLAMKELSMMFSSPTRLDESYRNSEVLEENQQIRVGRRTEITAFSITEGLAGNNIDNNNSILAASASIRERENDENQGPRNPNARTNATPGFETMALRTLQGDSGPISTGCNNNGGGRRILGAISQDDPLRRLEETPLNDDPGFQIYEEEEEEDGKANETNSSFAPTGSAKNNGGFTVYQDDQEDHDESRRPQSSKATAFDIYQDTLRDRGTPKPSKGEAFEIYSDHIVSNEVAGRGREIPRENKLGSKLATAAFEIYQDTKENNEAEQTAVRENKHLRTSAFEVYQDPQGKRGEPVQEDRFEPKSTKAPFGIYQDIQQSSDHACNDDFEGEEDKFKQTSTKGPFEIYQDTRERSDHACNDDVAGKEDIFLTSSTKAPFEIYQDTQESSDHACNDNVENEGDTATLSLFGDMVNTLNEVSNDENFSTNKDRAKEKKTVGSKIHEDTASCEEGEGDTASLSLFGDVMQALNEFSDSPKEATNVSTDRMYGQGSTMFR